LKRLILTLFFCIRLFGQSPFSTEMDSLIHRGIDQTFFCQFDSALNSFKELTDAYPDHMVGYFYQAATLQTKMMDYETDLWEVEFYRLMNRSLELGEKQLDLGSDDPWIHFYMGSAYSYRGFYQAKSGSIIKGFFSAKKGLRYLKKVLELDSTLYDAHMGLGSYEYWSSSYLSWLPWIRDKRKEGIEKVRLSIEQGTFSYWVGLNNFAWIEYDRENYDKALSIFQTGLDQYPNSRFFIWGIADCYFKLEQWEKAVDVYEELLLQILNGEVNNGYNEGEIRKKLFLANFELKKFEESYRYCKAILDRKVDKKIERRLKEHRQLAEEYRMLCLEKLGRVYRR